MKPTREEAIDYAVSYLKDSVVCDARFEVIKDDQYIDACCRDGFGIRIIVSGDASTVVYFERSAKGGYYRLVWNEIGTDDIRWEFEFRSYTVKMLGNIYDECSQIEDAVYELGSAIIGYEVDE